jgi:hypothetical protein
LAAVRTADALVALGPGMIAPDATSS